MEPNTLTHVPDPSPDRPDQPAAKPSLQAFAALAELAAELAQTAFAALVLDTGECHEAHAPEARGLCAALSDPDFREALAGQEGWAVIPDLSAEPRLARHPLVTGKPHLRFLARAPLIARDGQPLGSLWVADPRARPWDDPQPALLRAVAAGIAARIECQRAERERERLQAERERFDVAAAALWRHRETGLQRANEELRAFTHSVAHELGGPLRALAGFSQTLLQDHQAALSGEAPQLLRLVADAARQMRQLTDDLLAFSRLSEQPLRKQPVATEALVREIIASLSAGGTAARAVFRVGPLAPCRADRGLLRQVFLNLLQNALKFSAHRDPPVIEVGSLPSNRGSVYYVRDNGVGFDPAAAADRLFRPFERLHSREQFEGSGVGLSIVKRIVERHGGYVWAEGQVNRGAAFLFHLGE